jgi:hypothetical protein
VNSPAVQFKAIEGGKTSYSSVYYLTYKGKPADFPFKHTYGHFFTSHYTTHLYVREARMKESNRNSIQFAHWKKLY